MSISGHKRVESIQSYAQNTSTAKKRQISDTLGNAIDPPVKMFKVPPPEDEPCRPSVNVVNNNKPPPPPPSASIAIPEEKANFDLSFVDLLELSPTKEEQVLNEMFTNEVVPLTVNKTIQNVQNNVQNLPVVQGENCLKSLAGSIMPKMQFNNSTVTINFNLK